MSKGLGFLILILITLLVSVKSKPCSGGEDAEAGMEMGAPVWTLLSLIGLELCMATVSPQIPLA